MESLQTTTEVARVLLGWALLPNSGHFPFLRPLAPASHPSWLLLSHSSASGSVHGLPVSWSLIVQRKGLLKGVFPMFEGFSPLFQTLELSHTSSFLLPFPSELGPLLAPMGCGDWANLLTCGVHFIFSS